MTVNLIGNVSFYDMNIYFFIYAFLGWIVEVVFATLKSGKFINRGFLNGPVCPIYGTGMAFLVLLINPLKESVLLLFLSGGIFCTLLELFTGFFLDKIFKTKWWDYSKERFNFKGYVCVRFSVIWGIAIVLMFKVLVPTTDAFISVIPVWLGELFISVLWAVFIVDVVATIVQLRNLKRDLDEVVKVAVVLHRNSDKIGEKVSDTTIAVKEKVEKLKDKIKNSRFGKAFPRINRFDKNDDKDEK